MYKRLEIWKESIDLLKEIYSLAEQLPKTEEFNLKIQLKRAMVSVPLNIAEGKCRSTAKDFSHFLNIAAASLDEVDVVITICEELGFFSSAFKSNIEQLHKKNKILTKRINALRKKLVGTNND